ncbi:MATE efflux family protein [Euphorbia peplus]|nr:MATE efflux family protein [Euphorbia peplus]
MDIEKHQQSPKETHCESKLRFRKDEITAEIKQQLKIAGPLISVFLGLSLIQMIGIIFVGHLGELPLSGASIATCFASMSGYTLLRGMGGALETYSGQSFGAKQFHLLGIHLQRGMLILLVISTPVCVMFAYSDEILIRLGQNPDIAKEAGKYTRFLIPGFFAMSLFECLIRFLQTQTKVVPLMVASGIGTALHIGLCWVLVFKSELGMVGAALAISISMWILSLMLTVYVWFSPTFKETWTGFSKEAFRGIPNFLKLVIPATIMLSLEVWALEITVLLSGLLPNPELEASVLSICFNLHMFAYMLPFGHSGAVSTRVSNELGAGRPRSARLAAYVAVVIVAAEGFLVSTIVASGHKVWGYIFSDEKEVVEYVGQMLPLLACSHFINGIQTVLSGSCRGCGWQKIGALINFGAYYFVGIPLAIFLAFVSHMGGKGLWIGITVAMFVQATSLSIITLCIDWDKEARRAKDRVQSTIFVTDVHALE